MAKKKIELPPEAGIIKREVVGKSYSQVVNTQYDIKSIDGSQALIRERRSRYQSLQDHLDKVEQQCIDELNDFLNSTYLRQINDRYKGTEYRLSDAYFLEDNCLCYFELNTFSEYREQAIEYHKKNKHWQVESLRRHKQHQKQPDVIMLSRPLLNDVLFRNIFKLEHDSFETLAAKMLYKIRLLSNEGKSMEERISAAISYGETKQLYDVYLRVAVNQSKRSQGKKRNKEVSSVIQMLVRHHPEDSAKQLWQHFLNEMKTEDSMNENGKLYCNYEDNETGALKPMYFTTFSNKVSEAKKK